MGNSAAGSASASLEGEALEQCLEATVFSGEELQALYQHFRAISAKQPTINRRQFQAAMLFKDTTLLDRIFRIFDSDDDNHITFLEYVSCLSTISTKSSREEKLKFSFKIYDFDGDNYISTSDLMAVVSASLRENKVMISREDIEHIVEETMKEADPKYPDMISFSEYKHLMTQRPLILAQLSLNISNIISEYTAMSTITLATPRGKASAVNMNFAEMN